MSLLRRNASEDATVPRRHRSGASAFKVGLIALVVIVVATYLGFTKHIPFTHGFRVQAVFQSANSIRPNSPVRIAGVNVGKVTSIERTPGADTAIVTMEIHDEGLPIHKDATAKIRPRIFLEGNFFVDLQPGTPSTPTIDDGDTLPVSQTAGPVQLDQVLTALQQDTRTSLQRLVGALAVGLTYKPPRALDTDADPSARGQSAAESLNDSIRYGPTALRGTAEVTAALTGLAAARPLAADPRAEPDDRGPEPQRGAALGPRHELQPDGRGDGVRGDEPAAVDPPPRADAPERRTARSTASTPRSPTPARSPARSCRACARRRRRSTPGSRGSPRPARSSARTSCRGSSTSSARRRATSRR